LAPTAEPPVSLTKFCRGRGVDIPVEQPTRFDLPTMVLPGIPNMVAGMQLLHAFRVTHDRREGLMRIALIATMIAALTIPAFAQRASEKIRESGFPVRDADIAVKKELAKESDKGYKASLKVIPDKKQPNDPWKNVR
jgi:hypothetical protein